MRKTTAKSSTDVVASFEMITPELATEYLATNVGNQRNISTPALSRYTNSMEKGLWRVNGEAIKFDTNNMLCDGQHRLTACIKANIPFESLVIRGLDPKVFDSIDTGKVRSSGDILRMLGVRNYSSVSCAIRVWIALSRIKDEDIFWEYKPSQLGIDNHSVREAYLAGNKKGGGNHWEESGDSAIKDYRRFMKLTGPTAGLFAYHFLTNIDHAKALEYLRGLDTGMPQLRDRSRNKYCPTTLVKEKLVDIRLKTSSGKHYHRYLLHEKLFYIVEGWNYFARGECMNQLSKSADAPLPIVENSPIIKNLDSFGRLL